jgi:two-component system sensor histidine kinase YesM
MDLLVRDDGIGMNAAVLEKLRRKLRGSRSGGEAADSDIESEADPGGRADVPGSGVGVRNVDERIKLYFGPDYGLAFESREDAGTTVFIHLPAIRA